MGSRFELSRCVPYVFVSVRRERVKETARMTMWTRSADYPNRWTAQAS
jgi:hypothetical protein